MNHSSPLRGIFFDLDDTLIRYTEAERIGLAAGCRLIAERHPTIHARAFAASIYQAYAEEFTYGTPGYTTLATLPVEAFRMRITGAALRHFGIEDPALTAALVDAYRMAERDALCTYADAAETLRCLRPHFRLGIITNGPATFQREKIAAVALTDWFAEIVIDTEFGCPKPDPRVFAHAAERIGCAPHELLFVGNSREADVEGARNAGWTSVWLNAPDEPTLPTPADQAAGAPDYTIRCLTELQHLPPIAALLKASSDAERFTL